MRRSTVLIGTILLVFVLLSGILLFGCAFPSQARLADTDPSAELLYASSGSMLQLLDTNQIDAFIMWEPVVSDAELAGIGSRVATADDLPPPGKWAATPCCVLVLSKKTIRQYPEIAALLSALTTAGVDRVNENPQQAENITAAWVFGTTQVLTPNGSLNPLVVEEHSFPNIVFTSTPSTNGTGPSPYVNAAVTGQGNAFLNGSAVPQILNGTIPTLNIGYLPSSDHYAPLYVLVRDSSYFCSRYGYCLVPSDPTASRPKQCKLLVNGSPVAYVNLVPGQSGGGIMTTIGQEALDGAYLGSVPAEQQIGLGNPSSIIQPVNNGGSGLVVGTKAPCTNWSTFVSWAKVRSGEGNPLVIATVQSSIQETMIREALAYENITVYLYGTHL